MKILKLYPHTDNSKRFNYNVNFGVWDKIKGDRAVVSSFNHDLNDYDVVFLPQIKRWSENPALYERIKDHKVKKVLFDNDSCYRSFKDKIYSGIDYIFYRDTDKHKKKPPVSGSLLMWSVDTERLQPVYGGKGIAFNCSIGDYPLRKSISTFIRHSKITGDAYIHQLQHSAAAIHTDSPRVQAVRAKILEFAACGTQIISNRTSNMHLYFPDELIVYFEDTDHLKRIVNNFKPDVSVQKQLREIAVEKHDNRIRAKQVINILKKNL